MEEQRLLLPFTYGINTQAILSVLRLAHSLDATVVPVSLIALNDRGIRPGRIEQSKDFLEAICWRAEQLHVPVTCHEVMTHDVQQSIRTITQEWCCAGVIVVVKEQRSLLLEHQELRALLEHPPTSLVILRLPAHNKGGIFAFLKTMTARMSKRQAGTDDYLNRVVASVPYSVNGSTRIESA